MYAAVCVSILIDVVSVIPQASWLSSSWLLKKMEGSVLCMMNAVPLINQSGPYSSLTVGRRAITATETYGKVFIIQVYLYYDGCNV